VLMPSPYDRLLWGAAAIGLAIVLGRLLKWIARRYEERSPSEELELLRLRRRETALVLVATAIPYATAIVVLIVIASLFIPAAVLGGSAFIAIVLGFAAQRVLGDTVASPGDGTCIAPCVTSSGHRGEPWRKWR
jgi:small-conductance mechanosensitive channel